jgi:4-hydroxybenzoate polyprenyltransferase
LADILAGYAVGGAAVSLDLLALLASSACLYAGGVVLNDVFDRRLDAVERPERPIPSGKISVVTAGNLGAGLLVAGIALASLAGRTAAAVASLVAGAVVLYDAWGKHRPLFGPVNMGLCRGLNLLLGMAAAPGAITARWPLALLPLAYIAGVTVVSRGEVHGGRRAPSILSFGLVAGVIMALGVLALRAPAGPWLALLFAAALAWRVLPAYWRAIHLTDPATLRGAVRTGVLSLVFLDAAIAAMYADIIYSLAVMLTGIVAVRLARLFDVT